MTSKIVLYPTFAECSEYTLDPYWKDIFKQCSRNKFPKGCSYDPKNHVLYVKDTSRGSQNHRMSINLPDGSSETFDILMNIFRKNLKCRSPQDLQRSRQDLKDIKDSIEVDLSEWKKIKPRSLKDIMIMRYISKMEESLNLTKEEANELYTTIKVGMQFNKIKPDDIDYSNETINSIQGLEYDENTRTFKLNNEIKCAPVVKKNMAAQKFNQAVDYFIKDYKIKKLKL